MMYNICMQKILKFFINSNISTKINKFLGCWKGISVIAALYLSSWCLKYVSNEVSLIFNMVISVVILFFGLLFGRNVKVFYTPLMFFMVSIPSLPMLGALHWSLIVSCSVVAFCLFAFLIKKLLLLGGLRLGIGPFNITLMVMLILMIISYAINANSGQYIHQYVGSGAALLVILFGMILVSIVSFVCHDPEEPTFKKDFLFHLFIVLSYYLIIQFIINLASQAAAGVDFNYYLDSIGWGNRNTFGKLGCVCLIFLYFKLIKDPRKYWFYGVTYIVLLAAITMINSRGALGFAVVLTIVLMIDSIIRWKKHYLEILLIYMTVIAVVACLIASIPEFKNLFSRFFEEQYDLNGRDVIWEIILNDTFSNKTQLIIGGSTIYLFKLSPILNVFEGNTFLLAHSTFFTYLATLGILGIILFVVHSGTSILQTFKYFENDDRLLLLIIVILGVTYGIIDNTNFEFVYSLPLILIMATGAKKNQPMIVVGENKKLQVRR